MKDILVAIDPASFESAAALFTLSGEFITTFQLSSNKKTWGARFLDHHYQFNEMITPYKSRIATICYERNLKSSVSLLAQLGALIICLPEAICSDITGVAPTSWKAWYRRTTNTKIKSPKGAESLRGLGGQWAKFDGTDDMADSCMIAMYYLDKLNNHE